MASKAKSASSLTAAPKPLPKFLKSNPKKYEEYKTCLADFRDYCEFIKKNNAKDSKGGYQKYFLEHLKKAADSHHAMTGRSYPSDVSEYFREQMAEVMLEMDVLPVFCDHVMELLPARPKGKNERNVLDWCMKLIMNSCYFLPGATRAVARHPNYLQVLGDFIKDSEQKPDKFWKEMLTYSLHQVFHISRVGDNTALLLKAGFESILKRYTESPVNHCRLAALATLPNIVDEDEETDTDEASKRISKTDVYKITDQSVDFLLSKVKDASKDKTGISEGWPRWVLLEVVGNLARNDDNSRLLVQRGCLPYLAQLANTGDLKDETVAVKSLESLAFNEENASEMVTLERFDLIIILQDLLQVREDKDLRFHITGLLFTLKEKLKKTKTHKEQVKRIEEIIPHERKKRLQATRPVAREDHSLPLVAEVFPDALAVPRRKAPQVMLSYNREQREKVKPICMFLLEKGFKVWFDMKDMTGDTYAATADAIETSDIICICFSRAYKESKYCRVEAEYADALEKPLVPLKMEDYNPTGWLGFIITRLLYLDFTGKYPEEDMRQKLLKELDRRIIPKEDTSSEEISEMKITEEDEGRVWISPSVHATKDNEDAQMTPDEKDEACKDGPLTDKGLSSLATELGQEWESVVLHLGLTAANIFSCEVNNPHDTHGQILDALAMWRNRSSDTPKAKLQALIIALEANERKDLAAKLIARMPEVEGARRERDGRTSDPLGDESLSDLAGKLGRYWKQVAVGLGLPLVEIDRCQNDYPRDLNAQIRTALIMWRDSNSRPPDIKRQLLVSALRESGRSDLAAELADG